MSFPRLKFPKPKYTVMMSHQSLCNTNNVLEGKIVKKSYWISLRKRDFILKSGQRADYFGKSILSLKLVFLIKCQGASDV